MQARYVRITVHSAPASVNTANSYKERLAPNPFEFEVKVVKTNFLYMSIIRSRIFPSLFMCCRSFDENEFETAGLKFGIIS